MKKIFAIHDAARRQRAGRPPARLGPGSSFDAATRIAASAATIAAGATFYWTIDSPNVTIWSPGNQTNNAGDSVNVTVTGYSSDNDALTYTATGLPSYLTIDPTSGEISGTVPLAAASADYTITIIGTDESSAVATATTFYWTIDPPNVTMNYPGDQANYPGDSVYVSVYGSSSDGDAPSYTAAGLPDGLSIDPASGTITGTIAADAASSTVYAVTITGTDEGAGVAANTIFYWTVNPLPVANLVNPGDQYNFDGDVVSLQLSATDTDGGELTYTVTGGSLPPGLNLDPNAGAITGTISPGADAGNPYSVTVTATDSNNADVGDSQTFAWYVVNPVWFPNPGDQTDYDGDLVSLQLPDVLDLAGNPLTFAVTSGSLPPGLSLDSGSGDITGTISTTADQNSPYTLTITATDSVNNVSVSESFTWTVDAVTVSFTQPSDQSNYDGDSVALQLSASDNGYHPLTYTVTAGALPPGLSLDNDNGYIIGNISPGADGGSPYSVTVMAADNAAQVSDSQTFNWTVSPVTVSLANPGDETNNDGDAVGFYLSATDSAGHSLTYSADPSAPLPPGLTLDPNSGRIYGVIDDTADQNSPYTVTVIATDAAANLSDSQTFTWTVNAATPEATDSVTTPENQSYIFAQGDFGIVSGDGTTAVQIDSLPTGGTLADNGTPVTVNQQVSVSDISGGLLTYMPNQNQYGTDYDSFDFALVQNGDPGGDPEMEINVTQVDQPAYIQVTLPSANAVVLFNGQQTTSTGTSRLYNTPALSGPGPYTYTITATYMVGPFTVEDQRSVEVAPGETSPVNFNQPGPNPLSVSAFVLVTVPMPNATVTLNGIPTTSTGHTRLFVVPPLQSGSNYTYTLAASWTGPSGQPQSVTRTVQLSAGVFVQVDAVPNQPRISYYPPTGETSGRPPWLFAPFVGPIQPITPPIGLGSGGGRYSVLPDTATAQMWFRLAGLDDIAIGMYYTAGTTGPFYTPRWVQGGLGVILPVGGNPSRPQGQPRYWWQGWW